LSISGEVSSAGSLLKRTSSLSPLQRNRPTVVHFGCCECACVCERHTNPSAPSKAELASRDTRRRTSGRACLGPCLGPCLGRSRCRLVVLFILRELIPAPPYR
jgi:hypothetical protein